LSGALLLIVAQSRFLEEKATGCDNNVGSGDFMAARESKPVTVVNRALSILGAFHEHSPVLTLAELSKRTGLYKSTLLRLIFTLERAGYIARGIDGTYRIGHVPFRIGRIFQLGVQPAGVVVPILEQLAHATDETASFAVRSGDVRVILYGANSRHALRDQRTPGDSIPLNVGAAGAIFMAFSEPYDRKFATIRRALCAKSMGQVTLGAIGLAAPVFGSDGKLAGAVSVVGPASRLDRRAIANSRKHLLNAARALTTCFGGDPSQFDPAIKALSRK
jgi:DNA-binding IclR family transcriptional regulator